MAMNTKAVLAVVGLFGTPLAVYAQSVTYDFTGTGEICTLSEIGFTCTSQTFTGTLAIDVLAEGPSGPDGYTYGGILAYDENGWVRSHFVIRWDSEEFDVTPVPGLQSSFSTAAVENDAQLEASDVIHDRLLIGTDYFGESSGETCERGAVLERWTTELSWLSDLSFDLSVGLAPGSDAINTLGFVNFTRSCSGTSADDFDRTNFYGRVELTSLTPRTSVAIDIKPGSLSNSINPRNKGAIPVAVLGSGEFDATQVDSSTARFGPGHASPVRDGRVEDVNGDGYADMLFHFSTQTTGITCGSDSASLSGKTFSDQTFEASDSIRTVGCKK
jgi:hypothetical protein